MDMHTLHAEARTESGKGSARKLRGDGKIPAIAYGGTGDTIALSIVATDLRKLRTEPLGWNTPLTIAVDGGEAITPVLLKSVQKHPVSGALLHADFIRVDAAAPVTVKVPVEVTGKAEGIAFGGRVAVSLREVDLVCAIDAIPTKVVVDVTKLDVGDKVLLQALPLPEGLKVASRNNPPVVACVGKRGARKAAEAAAAELAAGGGKPAVKGKAAKKA